MVRAVKNGVQRRVRIVKVARKLGCFEMLSVHTSNGLQAGALLAIFNNLIRGEDKLIHSCKRCNRAVVNNLVVGRKVLNCDNGFVVVNVLVLVNKADDLILSAELEGRVSCELALGRVALQSLPVVTTISGD